jgi:hypothetical protein
VAANNRSLGLAELAWRLRQANFAAHQAGPFGRERDFEFRLARERAQAARDRPLERLGRGFLR